MRGQGFEWDESEDWLDRRRRRHHRRSVRLSDEVMVHWYGVPLLLDARRTAMGLSVGQIG